MSLTTWLLFGNNLDSKAMGTKAIIKVANRYFEDEEVNKIALVAPHAKLNIIRNTRWSKNAWFKSRNR